MTDKPHPPDVTFGVEAVAMTMRFGDFTALDKVELKVRPGRKPGVPQVAPPSPERAKPMSVEPPLKKRPTWNAPTTVLP